MKLRYYIYLIVLLALLGVVYSTFQIVEAGSRGVVTRVGQVDRVLEPGFHIVNPILEDVHTMDVQVQLEEVTEDAASKDLQSVSTSVKINYHLDPLKVGVIYENVGRQYRDKIINPAVQESIKAGTAQYTAEEQINKRSEVKEAIKKDLSPRLLAFDVVLDDLSITDLSFTSEFDAAIEAKQVAEQNAKKAQNDLERVKFEQQQAVEKAKAEAESTRLQVQALSNSAKIIELRKVEAMLEMAKKWNGNVPQIITGGNTLPFLNLSEFSQ